MDGMQAQRMIELIEVLVMQNHNQQELLCQIKAILTTVHGMTPVKSPAGVWAAVPGKSWTMQEVMDLIDPLLKVTLSNSPVHVAGIQKLVVVDSSRTPESLYPTNQYAVEGDNIWQEDYWCTEVSRYYSDCCRIAEYLHKGRTRHAT